MTCWRSFAATPRDWPRGRSRRRSSGFPRNCDRNALRVVLDTNLYVSALWNPQGVPAQVVAAYQAGRFTLVASTPMLVEVETVLRRAKFARRSAAPPADRCRVGPSRRN